MKKSIGPKTFLGAVPVLLVGSYDEKNKPNLMTCAWGGICCSEPPCINISLRKNRYSYNGINSKKAFTVNIPFSDQTKEADYYGIVSGANYNKFEDTEITPIKSDLVDAPYGKEFPIVVECKVINQIELGSHVQFIGEVLDVKIEESLLDKEDNIVGEKLDPIMSIPVISEYFALGKYIGKGFTIGKDLS
ncbi:MAG: flavin reductase family protein [Atribacterota bacterium]|nr:flavin reductase family protein [Atribacterota bacterium]